jgi:hypothetical protein
MAVLSAALFAVAFASPAAAQDVDDRWMAFLGCWEPTSDEADAGLLCVRPLEGGVELFTVVDGEVTTSDVMVANGEQRTRSMEGCRGSETSEFSADGRRVFTRSEFVCGESLPRSSTGVMSLTAPTQWLDVRSMDVDGEQVAWVQEYQLVGPERMAEAGVEDATEGLGLAVRAARMSAARRITLTEVREAAQRIESKAVEAWVASRGDRFEVDADALIQLADDGVAESIIDVVVAVSYPETFSIGADADAWALSNSELRASRAGGTSAYGTRYGFGARSFYWDPFYYGSWGYNPYNSYRGIRLMEFGNGYGFNTGGYPYYGGYNPYGGGYGGWGGRYVTVQVERTSSTESARVVNGRGYRRAGGSGSTASSTGSYGGGGSGASSGGLSSGGGSVGSSGGSSGSRRTAKPRRSGGRF